MVGERLHKGTRVRNSARELDRRRQAGRFNGPQDVLESKEFSVLAARRKKRGNGGNCGKLIARFSHALIDAPNPHFALGVATVQVRNRNTLGTALCVL